MPSISLALSPNGPKPKRPPKSRRWPKRTVSLHRVSKASRMSWKTRTALSGGISQRSTIPVLGKYRDNDFPVMMSKDASPDQVVGQAGGV